MDNPFDRLERHFHLPAVAQVPLLKPFEWIGRGWEDLRRSPILSLGYGVAIAVLLGLTLSFGLDRPYLFTASVSGFLLLGPILAVGLYEISRRHGAGDSDLHFRDTVGGWRRNGSSIGLFGIFLAIVAIGWERLSAILFALLYGGNLPTVETFFQEVFLSGDYPRLVVGYVLAGGILAVLVFAASAVSIPMMTDRDTDVATAMMTSFKAVAANPGTMLLWAACIVVLTAIGFATFLAGMVFVMPILGHATWHAYKDLVR